jgi:hypothetical protein
MTQSSHIVFGFRGFERAETRIPIVTSGHGALQQKTAWTSNYLGTLADLC